MSTVTLATVRGGQSVTFDAVADPPTVTGGVGGHSEVARPRKPAAVLWDGYPTRRLTIPGMFDGHAAGASVEPRITALMRLARPSGSARPPAVRVTGPVVPADAVGAQWVIDAVQFGDVIRRDDGARTRQAFTVELVERVDPAVTVRIRPRPPARKLVQSKPNETIRALVKRVMKTTDAKRVQEVVRLNRPWAKRPDQVIKPPRKVRVPA